MRTHLLAFWVGLCLLSAAWADSPPFLTEEKLKFAVPGQPSESVPATLVRPSGSGPFSVVVLLPEDRGCTDWELNQARRLAAATGRAVLLVDLYRGAVPADEEAAHILERGLPDGRAVSDVRRVLDGLTAARRADLRLERVSVVGTGLGAAVGLELACADARVAALAVCYGRLILSPEKLRPLRAELIGVYAEHDAGCDDDTRRRFARALVTAGRKAPALIVYPRVEHGFLRPVEGKAELEGPAAEAAADAWKRIERFLQEQAPNK